MTTLYIDRRDTELRREGKSLVVFTEGQRRRAVPLKLLERVVVFARTRLDTSLLTSLNQEGVAFVVVSRRDPGRYSATLGPLHNDARVRLAQYARTGDAPWCTRWAADLVGAKLRAHGRFLGRALEARPDLRRVLTAGRERLRAAEERVGAAGSADTLRGIEGAAARSAFEAYRALFPGSLGFEGRRRRIR